jgi:hypothetical protein
MLVSNSAGLYCCVRYKELLSQMVHWSTLTPEEVYQHITESVAFVRGAGKQTRGSLVLLKMENYSMIPSATNHSWIYARVAGYSENNMVLLYLDPEESVVHSVSFDQIIPISPDMVQKYFMKENCTEVSKTKYYVVLESDLNCSYFSLKNR